MTGFLERLSESRVLIADGAMGTMLFQMGLEPGQCPEAINLTHPEFLEEIAASYLRAGAELIQTNTFGGSPLKLAQYGLEGQAKKITENAVRAVRRVVGDRAYVSGSCGPCGRILKPYGDVDQDEVYAGFRSQMESLVGASVDVICVETMTDLAEAGLAIKAAKDVSPAIPVMTTMTFDATPRGFFTIMGVSVEQAAVGLAEAGADVIGSNCGNGIENMIKIARELRRRSELPLIIQSNAGLPRTKEGITVYDETPEFMAEKARELIDLGVAIIGGCCGTPPEHIAALRRMADSHTSR
ncbi:homocysteine S-methyltransferase family protein [bacterium]|nr:homocysteine S-methyltransferase family protein [bacterium]